MASPTLTLANGLPAGDRPGPYLRVHAVTVYVRDQDRALQFYVEKLGFEVTIDALLQSGERWVAVAPPDGSTVLSLVVPARNSPQYKQIGRATHVVFVTEDVTATFSQWSARGVHFLHTPKLRRVHFQKQPAGASSESGRRPVWGGIFTRFEDADHNSFSLVSLDVVSEAIEAQRRTAAAKLEAERRAAQELEIAKQVQARLFPQARPSMSSLEYAGECVQARQVGGDYYDFLQLGQHRLGLVVGDIAGKGIAAALLMANLQANLRSQCAIALDAPERFLHSVNQLLYENTGAAAYATLFFGEYDNCSRRLRYVNCGHLPGIICRRKGGIQLLDSTCTVVGLFREWNCCVEQCELEPGDLIAIYTDGVTESANHSEEEFGQGRLIEALQQTREQPARSIVDSVLENVTRFGIPEHRDDITIVVAKCVG